MKTDEQRKSSGSPFSASGGRDLTPLSSEPKDGELNFHIDQPSNLSDQHRKRPMRSRVGLIISHLFTILWLLPIIALLYLNFSRYVIGPSVWCPAWGGQCSSNAWGIDSFARALQLNKNDRNTLGALQFVAKALEVWFIMLASFLVYDLAMIISHKEGGLPVGLMLTHLEFSNVENLWNPAFWLSAFSDSGSTDERCKRTRRLLFFCFFTAFLTALANLMGPASAVLVLPTLQWIETPHDAVQSFQGSLAAEPLTGDSILKGCNATALVGGNFSCTRQNYQGSLYQLTARGLRDSDNLDPHSYLTAAPALAQESLLTFLTNVTSDLVTIWAPSRQVLRDLADDVLQYPLPVEYGAPPTALNDSLNIITNREGPSIGFSGNFHGGNVTVTKITPGKEIHCFSDWTQDAVHNYTKCYRVGQDFNAANRISNFVMNSSTEAQANETSVDVFFSDKATFFDEQTDFDSGIKACLSNTNAPSCDWETIFDHPLPEDLRNSSRNALIISYSIPRSAIPSESGVDPNSARLYAEHMAFLDYPVYAADTSPSNNPAMVARVMSNATFKPQELLTVDPDWFLAAWSADRNGTTDNPASQNLLKIIPAVFMDVKDLILTPTLMQFYVIHFSSMIQMFSMIPYRNQTIERGSTQPAQGRVLHTWARRQVWAYSLDSRTSKLGVIVVIMGALCAILRLVLAFICPVPSHRPVDLMLAALRKDDQGELQDADVDPRGRTRKMKGARIRYRIHEKDNGDPAFVSATNLNGSGKMRSQRRGWAHERSNADE